MWRDLRLLRVLGLLVLLSACDTPQAAAGLRRIEVSSGGFFGSTATQIYSDGRIIQDSSAPGRAPSHEVLQGSPQAFAAAAAVLATEGKRTKAALKPQPLQCLDYGVDLVRITPPIAGFDQVSTGCPDEAVSALMDRLFAVLAADYEP